MSEPVTKHFFDSQNNPDGVSDDGTWPFHPTAAGRRWIDLGTISNIYVGQVPSCTKVDHEGVTFI